MVSKVIMARDQEMMGDILIITEIIIMETIVEVIMHKIRLEQREIIILNKDITKIRVIKSMHKEVNLMEKYIIKMETQGST